MKETTAAGCRSRLYDNTGGGGRVNPEALEETLFTPRPVHPCLHVSYHRTSQRLHIVVWMVFKHSWASNRTVKCLQGRHLVLRARSSLFPSLSFFLFLPGPFHHRKIWDENLTTKKRTSPRFFSIISLSHTRDLFFSFSSRSPPLSQRTHARVYIVSLSLSLVTIIPHKK